MPEKQPIVFGRNILNYRKLKNMSLDVLSKRSGVSKSMLSQIEQEKTNPTVVTLWKIARALDVTVEDIIESTFDNQIEVLKIANAPVFYSEDKSCLLTVISPIHMSDNLELYHLQFKPYGINSSAAHYPKTEEYATSISGEFKVTSGDQTTFLKKGDTARYRADRHHTIENLTDQDAEAFLVVVYPK